MSDQIIKLTAAETAAKIASGELTAVEVTEAHLARIEAVDEKVHAFLHVDREGALAQARAVDAKRERGEKLGPLAGVPLALKDIFTTEGIPTTVGSKILEGWIPPYDATLTKRLKAADVVILGKTNMDEFAMGSSTENSAYGPTGNPWDLTRIPGGSGGGSSAALATWRRSPSHRHRRLHPPAGRRHRHGRREAAYGAVSRYGMVAFSSSLDQGGPCARTVLDAALLHEVIAGHDPMDSTSIDAPVPPVVEAARNGSVQGMRVGVVKQFRGEGYQAGVVQRFDESVELRAGAEIAGDLRSWTIARHGGRHRTPAEASTATSAAPRGRIHGASHSLLDYNRAGIPPQSRSSPSRSTGRGEPRAGVPRSRGRTSVSCASSSARSACPRPAWRWARCAATSTCR
ncbi:Glutamyl-tRNA(Gln) amidotransferase subunit A OS=Streptomyces albaduncus OX=68172 GN=gatA PE=3 SV=1 [Streptomyces griseoloalbus]